MPFQLPARISRQVAYILDREIKEIRPVSGGDINQARLVVTDKGKFFLKMNSAPQAARMFETEAKGLYLLAKTGKVATPAVIACGDTQDGAFLLLEYLETGYRQPGFWETFARSLADLHHCHDTSFGLDFDNFIGSLPQSNRRHDTWPDFFIQERLQPQVALAFNENKLTDSDLQAFEQLYRQIPQRCPAEPPALVHGDLWSGNFMVDAQSRPIIIDPSVAYAHREMDLAMTRLFGGFDRPFYRAYEEAYPLEPGFEERLSLYQLYYLLVHVNLFGSSYVGAVRNALQFLGVGGRS
jgi:hypothetical protein